jgi:chromosome segregation ATPase
MAAAQDRIGTLEMRVERLETWAGPGQADALTLGLRAVRADLAALRRVQNQHTALLEALTADVSGLKTDVAGLKTDVAGLKTDVAQLKTDVAELKTDVAELKTDVAELKAAVQEILRRLPPPA